MEKIKIDKEFYLDLEGRFTKEQHEVLDEVLNELSPYDKKVMYDYLCSTGGMPENDRKMKLKAGYTFHLRNKIILYTRLKNGLVTDVEGARNSKDSKLITVLIEEGLFTPDIDWKTFNDYYEEHCPIHSKVSSTSFKRKKKDWPRVVKLREKKIPFYKKCHELYHAGIKVKEIALRLESTPKSCYRAIKIMDTLTESP